MATDFRSYAVAKLRDYMNQVQRCAGLLSDEQAWQRVNERSNSVGNLLLHLRGNVTQWILSGLDGAPDHRDRPSEFSQTGPLPCGPLLAALRATVDRACAIIAGLSDARLCEVVSIQGYRVSVLAAVFHVVEHFAFHTGQIVWAVKAMLNVDLSLYDSAGRRLDARRGGAP